VRISSAVYGTPDLIGVDSDRRLFTEGLKCLSDRDVVISIECLGPQVKATKKLYPGIGMLKTDLEAGLAGNAPADFLPSNPN
jgi:hypothetical protein